MENNISENILMAVAGLEGLALIVLAVLLIPTWGFAACLLVAVLGAVMLGLVLSHYLV